MRGFATIRPTNNQPYGSVKSIAQSFAVLYTMNWRWSSPWAKPVRGNKPLGDRSCRRVAGFLVGRLQTRCTTTWSSTGARWRHGGEFHES